LTRPTPPSLFTLGLHTWSSHLVLAPRTYISSSPFLVIPSLHTWFAYLVFTPRLHTASSHLVFTGTARGTLVYIFLPDQPRFPHSHLVFTPGIHTRYSHLFFTPCLHGCRRWYAPSPRHLRSLLNEGGWGGRAVVCGVVLALSCVLLFLLCVYVCDLFLFLQAPRVVRWSTFSCPTWS